MSTTLGIRNNNPFNIRYNNINRWKGLVGSNKGFCVFSDVEFGLRAGIYLLRKYIDVYKLKTVPKIISRFAPPTENDTRSYISYVCNFMDIPLHFEFDLRSDGAKYYLYSLCAAMVKYESCYTLTNTEFNSVYSKYFK